MNAPVIPEAQPQQQQQQPSKPARTKKAVPPPSDALVALMKRQAAALTPPGAQTRAARPPAAFDFKSKSKSAWRDELIRIRLSDALPKKKLTDEIKEAPLHEIMDCANKYALNPSAPPTHASSRPLGAPDDSFDEDDMARQVAKTAFAQVVEARSRARIGPDAPLCFANEQELETFLRLALAGDAGLIQSQLCRLLLEDVISAVEPLARKLRRTSVESICEKVHAEAKTSRVTKVTLMSMVNLQSQEKYVTGPPTPLVRSAVAVVQQRQIMSAATNGIVTTAVRAWREAIVKADAARRQYGLFDDDDYDDKPTPGGPASGIPAPRHRRTVLPIKLKTALDSAWGSMKKLSVALLGFGASGTIRRMMQRAP
jgi:hypothetical protein